MSEAADPQTPAPALLEGVRVLDLTTVVFGPYCTQILADLGANVIKVEAPGAGDPFRWSAKAARTAGMAPGFMAFNRGKRSVALDLKSAEGAAAVRRLISGTDALVVNVRGKALERLGLDYEAVKAIRPDIVYVHCVGFAQNGPRAGLQAYDDVIQAASGAATLLPRVDGNPAPRYLPSLVADKVAGLHAAYATLAALFHRQRTGVGQAVEVPMFEAFSHFMLSEHLGGLAFDPANAPVGYARQLDPDRQPFPTADGHISLVPYSHAAWDTLFAVLGEPEFLDDPRFATQKERGRHQGAMYRRVAELTPRFTTAELLEKCRAAEIPAQAVADLSEVPNDPQLAASGLVRWRDHPSEGRWRELAPPVRFGIAPAAEPAPPPLLGADEAEW